jgi:hypothetical protein
MRPPEDRGEGAEILFFTGVRFVRMEDHAVDAKTGRSGEPRRRQPRR